MVIGAGALQVLRAAGRVAFGDAFAAAVFHLARFARPFPEPGVVVADAVLQPQADAVDLADFGAAPRRHVQADQQAVRPAIVFREIGEGQFFQLGIHAKAHSRRLAPRTRHRTNSIGKLEGVGMTSKFKSFQPNSLHHGTGNFFE